MSETSWEKLLPPLLEAAGIDGTGPLRIEPLSGGVSSDIVAVTLTDGQRFCAKRALPKLKVKSDWEAPLERNRYEVAWLRKAGEIVPGAVPRVIGEDRANGMVLLEFLPPEDFLLWKSELLAGRLDPGVPVAVAEALGRIHAATLEDAGVAAAFPTDHLIDALRLDPYLRYTAGRHPALSDRILTVLHETWTTKLALVHGDVSPKNILVARADGHAVLLDAECAWYGDPAFDGAFCLNHLLLKAVHFPRIGHEFLLLAESFATTWLAHFPTALREGVERRTAALLPCLMLARVDGKSPVEYLTADEQQRVREISMELIAAPVARLQQVFERVAA